MTRQAATSAFSGNGLPLALGGSALLHLGILFGVPAAPPASAHTAQVIEARLAPAAAAAPAAIPPQHQQAAPQHHNTAHSVKHKTMAHAEPASLPAEPPTSTASSAPPAAAPSEAPAAAAVASEQEISATTYYEGEQLDAPPRLLGDVQQIYPRRARSAEIEGSITLSLLINEHGEVDAIDVLSAQPPGYFEAAALEMLRKQRFTPAMMHNHAVKSRWRTTVRYRLQS